MLLLLFWDDFPAEEVFAVGIPEDTLPVDVRHGGVQCQVCAFDLIAERDIVVVKEELGASKGEWLVSAWGEGSADKIDGAAVVMGVSGAPWAKMAIMVVDEHVEMSFAVTENRAWGERMLHGWLAVTIQEHL